MYNKIVDTLKGIARDALRMKMIIGLQSERAEYTSEVNSCQNYIEEKKKDIARIEFKTTQIVDADPDKEIKLKANQTNIEYLNEVITDITKEIERYKTKIKIESPNLKLYILCINFTNSVL